MTDDIDQRFAKIEHLTAAYTLDHHGWLLAVQSLLAVVMARQLAGARDPQGYLEECQLWARGIVERSSFPETVTATSAQQFRERAIEKLETFFAGITVGPRQSGAD